VQPREGLNVGSGPADTEKLRTHATAWPFRISLPIPLPSAAFTISAVLTAGTMMAWALYLLSGERRSLVIIYGAGVVGLVALALTCETLRPPAASGMRWLASRFTRPGWLAPAVLVVLASGLWYRATRWPMPVYMGDSPDYQRMAAIAAATHRYFSLPWRTPGYTFPLTWIYVLAGIGNATFVHAWQIALSLLTAIVTMAIAYQVTRSRLSAFLALVVGTLLFPLASASGSLLTEVQAVFLATLGVLLVLAIHARRHAGAALLALGPVLALTYETRPALLPWVAVLGVAALAARAALWRQRAVLVAGALLTLAPIALLNLQSPYRALTVGPPADLTSQNLGTDRFSLYWTAPNSPALLEQFHDAIVTDGAETEYWLSQPPAAMAAFSSRRMATMERYVVDHAWSYAQLSLRRAPLEYRYDQPTDITFSAHHSLEWMLLVDLLLALAVVAIATWTRRGRWPFVALLGGLVAGYTAAISLFHVEPRYSLPALPVVVVLAVMGLQGLAGLVRGALTPFRPARLAVAATAILAVVLAVPASEAWLWPALVDDYAPKPSLGQHELASCYVGHQLLTSVAWQPGTSFVVAGGANGVAQWDAGAARCPWLPLQQDTPWDLDFSRDGTRLAVGSHNARVLDTTTWKPYPPPLAAPYWSGSGTEILSVSFDPTGNRVAYTATGFHFVGIYDVPTRTIAAEMPLPASPTAVRWSPDGSVVAVTASDEVVRLYDAALRPLAELPVRREATALAWSRAGRTLAAGDQAGNLYLWDLRGRLQGPPASVVPGAHRAAVRSLSFSPDGLSLASAGSDRALRIWALDGLTPTRTLTGDTAAVWGVDWSPDSRDVVTASADGSLGLWAAR
jgi:WD40 repeat protein